MASSVKNKMYKCSLLSILLISLFSLTACITTESGGIGDKADDQKAVEYSVQLALSYIRNGNWDAAKRHLKTALEIDDSSAEVFLTMALVFQNTRKQLN
jgi:type IV pilus assembly protein PilF